ncbi:LOW QUALITY PROTEIN: bryoporin-like [Plectropomus leopardus]|uniref:LOW QUALITY PROTEIN: bryoporin-like n=1 Tax=Plectropomus leopardus TaxID=160734 RepID=UPI001C4B185C|nr:LOW QUALITY PROTEIN: bryoporin-like [Plectropomus leopardus]
MHDTAEAHSHTLTTNRNCTIQITNVSKIYCLNNPKVFMESGFTSSPPQPTLRSGETEVCSFTKDDHTASGAVGVLTYELFHMGSRLCDEQIAVMFSVPFDYNIYKNWLALGLFPKDKPCDKEVYDTMYTSKDFVSFSRHEADGSGVVYKGTKMIVRGCMSNEGKAIIKLELYDRDDL